MDFLQHPLRRALASAPTVTPYCARTLEPWLNPPHLGAPPGANAFGTALGEPCGMLDMYLRVEKGVVRAAGFLSFGNTCCLVCGAALCGMVRDMPVDRALCLTVTELADVLGGLPLDEMDAAHIAVTALHDALRTALGDAQAAV